MNYLIDFIKGIVIGLFMLVPGISGGSIAIILGVYNKMLYSLNDLFKTFRKNFIFLFIIGIGGVVGIFLSSYILGFFIKNFNNELLFIFVGIIASHSINNLKYIKKNNLIKSLFYILVGLFLGFLFSRISISFTNVEDNFLIMLLLGILLAVALILPGVSVSYILLVFNVYDTLILAIKTIDYLYLLKFGFFLLLGILIVIKFMYYLLVRKKEILSNVIIGFIFSSIWIVLPKIDDFKHFLYFLIYILIGVLIKKIIPSDN